MRTKLILFALALICLVRAVSAISVGDVLNQNQVDNINFDTVNLQCQFDNLQANVTSGLIRFDFSCLSLEPIVNTTNYVVIRQPIPEYFLITEYLQCRQINDRPTCISTVRETILSFFRSDKLSLRAYLKEFQTKVSDVTSGDFNWGDLN